MPDNKTLCMVIDDGTKEVRLVNTFGKEICKIYIRPTDLSILDRYKALMGDFEDIVKPLADLDLKNDGTASIDEDWPKLKQVEDELKRRLNALFDMEEADAIFAKRSPFASVGGKFFVQHVLDALGGVIEQALAEEAKAAEARTSKYLKDLPTAKKPGAKKAPAKKRKPSTAKKA